MFWCTADPGWVTGTSYGISARLTYGITSVVYEGELDAEAWYRILESERVSAWRGMAIPRDGARQPTRPDGVSPLRRDYPEVSRELDSK